MNNQINEHLFPVIMAGGAGTRFWPLSRQESPKQILSVNDTESLLQRTLNRLNEISLPENRYIVTSDQQQKIIKTHLNHTFAGEFVIEPSPRNTCPCIGLTALHLVKRDPEAVMLVLPSDHKIENTKKFQSLVTSAVDLVREKDPLVTIGIKPTRPETGYGYIQFNEDSVVNEDIYSVKTFAEKPTEKTAIRFIKSGDFYWNSGIFIWRARRILEEIEEHLPDQFEELDKIGETIGKAEYEKTLEAHYNRIRPISIDYGIMESTQSPIYMIRGDFEWSDVGSWDEIYRLQPLDSNENAIQGEVAVINTKNSLIHSPDKLTAVIGLDNLLVVNTHDATLICPLDKSQQVKQVVEKIRKAMGDKYL